jgi:hypothetical protein
MASTTTIAQQLQESTILKAHRLALKKANDYINIINNASEKLLSTTDTANDNLVVESQQVKITTNNTSVTTAMEESNVNAELDLIKNQFPKECNSSQPAIDPI